MCQNCINYCYTVHKFIVIGRIYYFYCNDSLFFCLTILFPEIILRDTFHTFSVNFTYFFFVFNVDRDILYLFTGISDDLQLPPIAVATEQKRILGLKRPKTEGSSIVSTEFPKLENILTVSPKILQKRDFG